MSKAATKRAAAPSGGPADRPDAPRVDIDDPVRRLVRQRLDALGLSSNEVSRRIGRNTTYLWHFLVRGSPKRLTEQDRKNLAAVLEVDEDLLRHPLDLVPGAEDTPLTGDTIRLHRARPNKAGFFPANAGTVERTPRPPQLVGVHDAFAARVPDDSMEPRYGVGDILYLHPGEPANIGDGVCVTLTDDTMLLGLLEATDVDSIALAFLNPPHAETIRLERLRGIAREVGVRRRGA